MSWYQAIAPFSPKPSRANYSLWLGLSLMVSLLYGLLVLHRAFRGEYVVQDDARQHIFWMRRFLDPELFPQDLIADYFQSVAPWGYASFYRLFAAIGVEPLLLSKLLPPVLGLIATAYGFGVSLQLLPLPFTGFLASVLLNQVIWSHDDVASASARAFMVPLFLAFLYYLLRRARLACLVTIALEGLFYPQYVFVFAAIVLLQLVEWRQGRWRWSRDRQEYWFCAAALTVAAAVLLPYALIANPYGPVITAAEARQLPEFYAEGRGRFFLSDPGLYWLTGNRSGIFPTFKPPLMGLGIFLPLLLRWPSRWPLVPLVGSGVGLLGRIVVAALALFFAAHVLLFKLHLPSRYTSYTLRYALVFAAAIVLTLGLGAAWRWLTQKPTAVSRAIAWGSTALIAALIVFYPAYIDNFPADEYRDGSTPKLYEFFAQQPKQTLIASLSEEVDNLPVFAARSILVGREYAIPYHKRYAEQFRQRAIDLIQAHYSRDPAELARFHRTYGIDFWIVSRRFFRPGFLNGLQFKQYPAATAEAAANLKQGPPALATALDACAVFREKNLIVVEAACVERANRTSN